MHGCKLDICVCAQVIALQQQRKPIQRLTTDSHATREARYQVMISNLLAVDCKSQEAVQQLLGGSSAEE